jgi:hypothetical protein
MIKQILIKQLFKGIFINKNEFSRKTMPFCQEKQNLKGKSVQSNFKHMGGTQNVIIFSEFFYY